MAEPVSLELVKRPIELVSEYEPARRVDSRIGDILTELSRLSSLGTALQKIHHKIKQPIEGTFSDSTRWIFDTRVISELMRLSTVVDSVKKGKINLAVIKVTIWFWSRDSRRENI